MQRTPSRLTAGLLAVSSLLLSSARADDLNPGSLLIYPEFDNRAGVVTMLSVTNTDRDEEVQVEFEYVARENCIPTNTIETLTPLDNLTLITNVHNPATTQGFVYVWAVSPAGGPIAFNALAGSLLRLDGVQLFEYSVNPFVYEGISPHMNNNGLRRFDGYQYETSPSEIHIPRFLGQGGVYNSKLILIPLTGGAAFQTRADFFMYNDNEELYTTQYVFACWEKVPLMDISPFFSNTFLQDWTDQDPMEILGAPNLESGWFSIRGEQASSSSTTIMDPVVLAVLTESIGSRGSADLPFGTGSNGNGSLLATSNDGTF